MKKLKGFGFILFSLIAALILIISTYIINGSEREDVWLYIFSAFLIFAAAYENSKVKQLTSYLMSKTATLKFE